jgi:Ring finger domain
MKDSDRIIYQAIRAIRHPERYGPRRHGGNGAGQSRARGLTRAILDTFPVVKFGNSNTPEENHGTSAQSIPGSKDVETLTESHAETSAMELREWEMLDNNANVSPSPQGVTAAVESKDETEQAVVKDALNNDSNATALAVTDTSLQSSDLGEGSSSGSPAVVAGDRNDVMPAAIGRETCPICIMDFEEGDDLRLLPCEGKHRFHQSCVDPWLLELSSSCPICREGEMTASLCDS